MRGKALSPAVRHRVSGGKLRLVDRAANFDLDLTYIAPNLIAMGVPTASFWISFYRNPIAEVARFFATRHADRFWIFNCCPELPYPSAAFGGRVTRFDIKDHTPPRMDEFVAFVAEARRFLCASKDRVIAVHCKGGKGRTGSLCCAWLTYARAARSPPEALAQFAHARTDAAHNRAGRLSGVETPSQVRYVYQFHLHLRRSGAWSDSPDPPPACARPAIVLRALRLARGFFAKPGARPIRALVQSGGAQVSELVFESPSLPSATTEIALGDVEVAGDARVSLFEHDAAAADFSAHAAMRAVPNAMKAKGLVAHVMFHTGFLACGGAESGEQLPETQKEYAGAGADRVFEIDVSAVDKAHKRVRKGKHLAGSCVQLVYAPVVSAAENPAEAEAPAAGGHEAFQIEYPETAAATPPTGAASTSEWRLANYCCSPPG